MISALLREKLKSLGAEEEEEEAAPTTPPPPPPLPYKSTYQLLPTAPHHVIGELTHTEAWRQSVYRDELEARVAIEHDEACARAAFPSHEYSPHFFYGEAYEVLTKTLLDGPRFNGLITRQYLREDNAMHEAFAGLAECVDAESVERGHLEATYQLGTVPLYRQASHLAYLTAAGTLGTTIRVEEDEHVARDAIRYGAEPLAWAALGTDFAAGLGPVLDAVAARHAFEADQRDDVADKEGIGRWPIVEAEGDHRFELLMAFEHGKGDIGAKLQWRMANEEMHRRFDIEADEAARWAAVCEVAPQPAAKNKTTVPGDSRPPSAEGANALAAFAPRPSSSASARRSRPASSSSDAGPAVVASPATASSRPGSRGRLPPRSEAPLRLALVTGTPPAPAPRAAADPEEPKEAVPRAAASPAQSTRSRSAASLKDAAASAAVGSPVSPSGGEAQVKRRLYDRIDLAALWGDLEKEQWAE